MTPPPTVSPPPTVASPPPASDVPWWGALILAVVTAIVSVVGTIFFLRGQKPSVPGAPPGVGMLFTDIITWLIDSLGPKGKITPAQVAAIQQYLAAKAAK